MWHEPLDRSRVTERPRVVHVQQGEIQSYESWVYVWIELNSRRVIYVGSTNLNPELRSWLHLHDANPDIGRIIARRPSASEEDFDVLVYSVPHSLSRASVKKFLIQRFSESEQLSRDYIGEPSGESEVSFDVSDLVEAIIEDFRHL